MDNPFSHLYDNLSKFSGDNDGQIPNQQQGDNRPTSFHTNEVMKRHSTKYSNHRTPYIVSNIFWYPKNRYQPLGMFRDVTNN